MLAEFMHGHMRHRSAVNCLLEEETGKLRLKDKIRAFVNCLPFTTYMHCLFSTTKINSKHRPMKRSI